MLTTFALVVTVWQHSNPDLAHSYIVEHGVTHEDCQAAAQAPGWVTNGPAGAAILTCEQEPVNLSNE